MRLSVDAFRRFWNLWPPYVFSGIRVLAISPDGLSARVRLRLHWWNRNASNTHFGGSLLAMVNPFWPLLVRHRLGEDYIVWDTRNEIEFVRALREDVFAEFHLEPAVAEEMRAAASGGDKVLRWFPFEIASAGGEVAARGRIEVYVRRKRGR